MCEFLRYSADAGHLSAEVPMQLVERRWMPSAAVGRFRDQAGQPRAVRINVLRIKVIERATAVLSEQHQRVLFASSTTERDQFLLHGIRVGLRQLLSLTAWSSLAEELDTVASSMPSPMPATTAAPVTPAINLLFMMFPSVSSGTSGDEPTIPNAVVRTLWRDYGRAPECWSTSDTSE